MLLKREHVRHIINEKVETPFAQRNLLGTLRAMFQWATSEGRLPDDPTLGVKHRKVRTAGYKTWDVARIERFETFYPVRVRAFALYGRASRRRGEAWTA
jgi:hypothetical protein